MLYLHNVYIYIYIQRYAYYIAGPAKTCITLALLKDYFMTKPEKQKNPSPNKNQISNKTLPASQKKNCKVFGGHVFGAPPNPTPLHSSPRQRLSPQKHRPQREESMLRLQSKKKTVWRITKPKTVGALENEYRSKP